MSQTNTTKESLALLFAHSPRVVARRNEEHRLQLFLLLLLGQGLSAGLLVELRRQLDQPLRVYCYE